MIKTVYALRKGRIDCCMSVEWPENLSHEAMRTLAGIRSEPVSETYKLLVPEEVQKFCSDYRMLEMRARLNSMDGPHVINSAEPLTDAMIIAHHKQHKQHKQHK